jgi:hypothetical protein
MLWLAQNKNLWWDETYGLVGDIVERNPALEDDADCVVGSVDCVSVLARGGHRGRGGGGVQSTLHACQHECINTATLKILHKSNV